MRVFVYKAAELSSQRTDNQDKAIKKNTIDLRTMWVSCDE